MCRCPNGDVLPGTLHLLTPAQCQLLCISNDTAEQELLVELDNRDLVLCPISDGDAQADSGSHWSLLVIYRVRRKTLPMCFASVHLDSLHQDSTMRKASQRTQSLLGKIQSVQA